MTQNRVEVCQQRRRRSRNIAVNTRRSIERIVSAQRPARRYRGGGHHGSQLVCENRGIIFGLCETVLQRLIKFVCRLVSGCLIERYKLTVEGTVNVTMINTTAYRTFGRNRFHVALIII